MITLENERLRIELLEPREGTNCGFRFDHAGFISEVELDGRVKYCATEPKNLRHPTTWGRGLCNEYRFDISDQVEVGDYFPKFGIGLFKKWQDKKYIFYDSFKEVEYYPIEITKDNTQVSFDTQPLPCHGYALHNKKTVRIDGNRLVMEIEAENAGEKPIHEMDEFCHNFLSIDGMAVGSDYILELPQCPDLGDKRLFSRAEKPGIMRGHGHGLTFCEFAGIDTDISLDVGTVDHSKPFSWTLRHLGAGASVSCTCGFPAGKVVVWAVDHMVCPEITYVLDLEPGEKKTWSYTWTFDRG